jgi:acetyl-CoA acetyltransferase family protein
LKGVGGGHRVILKFVGIGPHQITLNSGVSQDVIGMKGEMLLQMMICKRAVGLVRILMYNRSCLFPGYLEWVMRIAIVGGVRTAFVKAGGVFGRYSSLELGKHVVVSCIEKLKVDPTLIDELYFGTVLLDPRYPNLAREIILRSGLPKTMSGHFVSNNCITGLVAANVACEAIASGRIRAAIVGGVESMSCPTLTFPRRGEEFFIALSRARSLKDKLKIISKFRPGFLAPQAPSPKEPSTGLTMGQHCELMAQEAGISRADQDQIALTSHKNALAAKERGVFKDQIVSFAGVSEDNLVRGDTSIEKLSSLPPVFDRGPKGTISAGNSSALTDGASAVCLMAEDLARKSDLPICGFIDAIDFASVPPGDGLLMGPALALPKVMRRVGWELNSVDAFEIHEAFAAQVLCNLKAWENGSARYPSQESIGIIPRDKINIFGGSIALGHPFAATGGRLLMNACDVLRMQNGRRALISVCAAGGGAAAVAVSNS